MEEFKTKLKETIKKEKEQYEFNKRRVEFVEKITKETDINLPAVLIDHEINRIQARFESDLQNIGSNLNSYLKNSKKTPDKFIEEIKPQAVKQAKLQLILNKIAEIERIAPKDETVDSALQQILKHHKNADPVSARAYVTMQIRNDMVFSFLENIANNNQE